MNPESKWDDSSKRMVRVAILKANREEGEEGLLNPLKNLLPGFIVRG